MFRLFKNYKAARKNMTIILLNIQAVENKIKPCYLWDAFDTTVEEIQSFLSELHSSGKTNSLLSVFTVCCTHFVTQKNLLEDYLRILTFEKIKVRVIDVTGSPSMLCEEDKIKALEPIFSCAELLLKMLMEDCDINQNKIDFSLCNITTLNGMLVGYPVLYWYNIQKDIADNTSLNMLPLVVYQVYNNNLINDANMNHRTNNQNIYAFSIPQCLFPDSESFINDWFVGLKTKSKNSIFNELTLSHCIRTLPCVSM